MLKKANDRARSRTYYQRRRTRFENLRDEVKKLTSKLAELQCAKANNEPEWWSSWRLMAEWQRKARLNAEVQQLQLRAAVDARSTLIHEFQTLLHNQRPLQRNLIVNEGHLLINNSYQHTKTHHAAPDTEIFAIYAQELDMLYAQIDVALHNFEREYTEDCSDITQTGWKEDRKPGNFLYMNKQVISSEFQDSCNFLWQVAFMTHRQECRDQCHFIQNPEDTVAIKFRISTRLNSGRIASISQRIITRRYQEGARVVLVWKSLAEGEGIFTDLNADESGWCVATPIKDSIETVLRTCMRHVPMHVHDIATQNSEVKEFTSFVLDTGSNDVFETTTKLEELLRTNE
ncbi:hypothetical protein PHMEG_00030173 [Phytophthora megakarya]|uniref:Uncharacterized protein n=1 Tax=Phytophthora megakarya TaxID=4795 RepID=A0A225UZF8_9STRA|nr:hypothetical protein PHMEG_00030173 [Phytophthora megakarya]